ncbi:hypothetical protein IID20_01870, partial [Patescibacteria group bacterium]|nr:hypothetical protein [Patescibacteria group bacterium]
MLTSESQFAVSKEKFLSEEEEVRLSPEQEERFNQINTRLQEIINIKDDPKKWNSLDLNEM